MRATALLQNPTQTKGFGIVARGDSVPAPVEGWDALSALANMPPKRAVTLDNWFPQPSWIELRNGFVFHNNTETETPVESVMAYHGLTGSNLKAASGGSLWDVTALAVVTEEVTGLANNRWQHVNFTTQDGSNFLWVCNGANDSRRWDGTQWLVNTITGDTTGSQVINVAAFKRRLWLVRNGSLNPAYLALGAIQGAATEFPLDGIFQKGGFLMTIGTWALDGGDGPDDYIAFISSRGEVAIYSGADPVTDMTLKGVYEIGPPIGRRCLVRLGGDLGVISVDGLLPLSRGLIAERSVLSRNVAFTTLIQPVMAQSVRSWGQNFGWQVISYPRGTRAILNVPVIENGTQLQYVMNTVTGAWCRFLGVDANCWEVMNDRLFFGGNDGIVYEMDVGGSDGITPIEADVETAFNYFGQRGRQKRWSMCRPLLTTDNRVTPGLAVNADFSNNAPIFAPTNTLSPRARWDEAIFEVAVFPEETDIVTDWQSVSAIGFAASVRMKVSASTASSNVALWDQSIWDVDTWDGEPAPPVTLQVNGWDIMMETGAFV